MFLPERKHWPAAKAADGSGSSLPGQKLVRCVRDGVPRLSRREALRQSVLAGAMNAAIVIGILLIFLPLVLTAYLSFFRDRLIVFPPSGYTLSWYAEVLPTFGGSILVSIEVALSSVGLAMLMGVPAAIGLARGSFPGRQFLDVLLLAPLTVPGISLGLAIYLLAVIAEVMSGLALANSVVVLGPGSCAYHPPLGHSSRGR